jgi:hypothetical protein
VTFALNWYESNVGDYNLDGQVGIGDLTPIAANYEATCSWFALTKLPDGDNTTQAGLANWRIAMADGDRSGAIDIGDLGPIAANYGSQLIGYDVYVEGNFVANPLDPANPVLKSQATMPSVARPGPDDPDLKKGIWPLYVVSIPVTGAARWVPVKVLPVGPEMVEEPTAETDLNLPYTAGIAPPTGVKAWPTNRAVTLSWDVQPSAIGYNVYGSQTSGDLNPVKVNTAPIPQQTTANAPVIYKVSNLFNGSVYYFRVTSINAVHNEGPKSGEVQGVPNQDPLYPAAPTVTLDFQSIGITRLAWPASPDPNVAYYLIYVSATPGDPNPTLLTPDGFWPTLGQTTVTYTNTDMPNAEYRYWRVRAVKWSGNMSQVSSEVKVWQGGMEDKSPYPIHFTPPPSGSPPLQAFALQIEPRANAAATAYVVNSGSPGYNSFANVTRRPFDDFGNPHYFYGLFAELTDPTAYLAIATDLDDNPQYPGAPHVWFAYSAVGADTRIYATDRVLAGSPPPLTPIHPTDTPDRLSMAVDDTGNRYICYGDGTNVRLATMPPGPASAWTIQTVTAGKLPLIVNDAPFPKIVYRAPDDTLHLIETAAGASGEWMDYKLGDATSIGWHGADYVNGNVNVAFVNGSTFTLCTYIETGDHVWTLHATNYQMGTAFPDASIVLVARHDLGGHLLVMGNTHTAQSTVFFYSPVGDKFFWPWLSGGWTTPRDVYTAGAQDFSLDPVTGELLFAYNDMPLNPSNQRTWSFWLSPMQSF